MNLFSDKKPCVSQCLPVLELESGVTIASVNQAARFIFPPPSATEVEVDQWLDWDSSQLQVIHFLVPTCHNLYSILV